MHNLSPNSFFMIQPYLLMYLQDNQITPLFDQQPIGCETIPTICTPDSSESSTECVSTSFME